MPSVEKYPDGHPNPAGAKKWADFILATLLKN
jgi:hypothetical protein